LTNDRWVSAGDNAYTVLGVRHDADDADIVSAYRSLARVYHPDVAGDGGNARMSQINAAWDRLRTPRRRDAYDRELGIFPVRRAPRRTEPRRTSRAAGQDHPIPTAHAAGGRHRVRDGTGGAGPPPGRPSGSVLQFGRHIGWSIGEVARVDPGYLEWLEVHREGAPYLDEIDEALVKSGFRPTRRRPTQQQQQRARRRFRRS
jgi:curved DNA-binding protein CbpA